MELLLLLPPELVIINSAHGARSSLTPRMSGLGHGVTRVTPRHGRAGDMGIRSRESKQLYATELFTHSRRTRETRREKIHIAGLATLSPRIEKSREVVREQRL